MTLRRIKLKVGIVEVEVEGDQSDLDKVAIDLLRRASELPSIVVSEPIASPKKSENRQNHEQSDNFLVTTKIVSANRKPTMTVLATNRNCKTGPDLARLACEYLHFVKSQHIFDRYEVLAEMQKVKSLYKKSFQTNIYHYHLKSLARKGILHEHKDGYFSLSDKAKKIAEAYFSKVS